MNDPVAIASIAICGSMAAIVVGAILGGILLFCIEKNAKRGEH